MIELANDDSYVPTKKAFSEGSYEVANSRVEAGGVHDGGRSGAMLKELVE